MVKSSGVEKGELFVGVQIRQLVLPFPLEAPSCVPLRLSPFGKRSAFSYLTLLVSHFVYRSFAASWAVCTLRSQACQLVIPDDEIILTQNVLSLLQKYCSH